MCDISVVPETKVKVSKTQNVNKKIKHKNVDFTCRKKTVKVMRGH